MKGGPQYLANVALKMNIKLGGQNQSLATGSLLSAEKMKKTMIVGLDVTVSRDDPLYATSRKRPMLMGCTASVARFDV